MKGKIMRITTIRLIALAGAMALSACSGSNSADQMDLPDNGMTDNGMSDANLDAPVNDVAPVDAPTPTPSPTASKAPVSADKDFTDPDQVKLDAESTGLTSRVDRSAPAPTPPATAVPAEQ